MPARPIALSFSGSGHLLCYQLGAARTLLFRTAWGERITHFAGSSGGAIAASVCALLSKDQLGKFAVEVACKGHGFAGLSDALAGHGPHALDDSQALSVNDRLFLSATHCRTGRNALFSRFESAEMLQRCVLASAAIPRAFHPFDMLKRNPTYPEAGGIIVPTRCESDGGTAAARDAPPGELPFSPHGEAFVDGGITNTAPLLDALCGAHTLTVSPVSGPNGCLRPGRLVEVRSAEAGTVNVPLPAEALAHYHLTPDDTSTRVPGIAPRLAGMRVYLSVDNLRALRGSLGASPRVLTRWYERGLSDAEQFAARFDPPD